MRRHRLHRLTLLTQGVALVGLGLAEGACHKDPPPLQPDEPHINAPPDPTVSAPTPPPSVPVHVNAPAPTTPPSAAPLASGAPSAAATGPKPPKHTNSPPQK